VSSTVAILQTSAGNGAGRNRRPDAQYLPRILIQPLKPAVIAGVAQKLPVLIRVQAPAAAPTESKARKPYHLALVIDRSGSMSGAPLIEAIRCTRHIIEQLEPTDMASLVIFDDRVQTLVAAQPVGDRQALHLALSRVHGGGSTNLYGGWKAGADGLLPAAGQAALTRVILLSDGNANVGEITDATAMATLCAHAAERGVTTSTYGLGSHFNEDLMVEMAKRGGGNHYYGDSASDLFEPFSAEFDFISALCARQVRLSLAAAPQVRIRLLNDYPQRSDTPFPVVHLPDIAFGAEAWALVELDLPLALAADGAGPLLQVAVTASTPEGEPASFADATLTLPAVSMAVPGKPCRRCAGGHPPVRTGCRQAARTGARRCRIRRLEHRRAPARRSPPALCRAALGDRGAGEHGGAGRHDGHCALPERSALLLPQDEFADFGKGRMRLPGSGHRIGQCQLPAPQDGSGQGAVRQAGG
jgi:hypothetical protein